MKPTIALVQGDAAGIGPELMTRLLALEEVRGLANVLVVSDARVFRAGCDVTGIETPVREISAVEDADYRGGAEPPRSARPRPRASAVRKGLGRGRGAAVLEWFGRALDLAMAGQVDGICFMPFNKQAMRKAGLDAEDELQWARARLDYDGRAFGARPPCLPDGVRHGGEACGRGGPDVTAKLSRYSPRPRTAPAV